jgi:hypothetical protein
MKWVEGLENILKCAKNKSIGLYKAKNIKNENVS